MSPMRVSTRSRRGGLTYNPPWPPLTQDLDLVNRACGGFHKLYHIGRAFAMRQSAYLAPGHRPARLLDKEDVRRDCAEVAERQVGVDPMGEACDVIEPSTR